MIRLIGLGSDIHPHDDGTIASDIIERVVMGIPNHDVDYVGMVEISGGDFFEDLDPGKFNPVDKLAFIGYSHGAGMLSRLLDEAATGNPSNVVSATCAIVKIGAPYRRPFVEHGGFGIAGYFNSDPHSAGPRLIDVVSLDDPIGNLPSGSIIREERFAERRMEYSLGGSKWAWDLLIELLRERDLAADPMETIRISNGIDSMISYLLRGGHTYAYYDTSRPVPETGRDLLTSTAMRMSQVFTEVQD